jgi:hypothetical protein
MLEPDEALIEFASSLPDTVRVTILIRCLIAFGRLETRADQDHLATFRSILEIRGALKRAYRVAAMAGVMGLALEDDGKDEEEFWQQLYQQYGVSIYLESALRAPLRARHLQAARKAFGKLLRGPLSPRMLHTWLQLLMAQEGIPRLGS